MSLSAIYWVGVTRNREAKQVQSTVPHWLVVTTIDYSYELCNQKAMAVTQNNFQGGVIDGHYSICICQKNLH